ncbi:MAG: hypothetical protein NT023_22420 [Armatimonadetes bacterium]|nr:hypothetical protein [Armatimonadota bacterium]
MAPTSANAWLVQAISDMRVAELLWAVVEEGRRAGVDSHFDLYCQVAAKCQQVVEKEVKAIHYKLIGKTSESHYIDGFIDAILAAPANYKDDVYHIKQVLRYRRQEIKNLMALAPKASKGGPTPKNTEYPYHVSSVLIAPASCNAFLFEDVWAYYRLAGIILARVEAYIDITQVSP